jgi:hypothetical protein
MLRGLLLPLLLLLLSHVLRKAEGGKRESSGHLHGLAVSCTCVYMFLYTCVRRGGCARVYLCVFLLGLYLPCVFKQLFLFFGTNAVGQVGLINT